MEYHPISPAPTAMCPISLQYDCSMQDMQDMYDIDAPRLARGLSVLRHLAVSVRLRRRESPFASYLDHVRGNTAVSQAILGTESRS